MQTVQHTPASTHVPAPAGGVAGGPSDDFFRIVAGVSYDRTYRRTGRRMQDWTEAEAGEDAAWGAPLVVAATLGINRGYQWHLLGWLAARYARAFTVHELAFLLWEVMQASPQDMRHPWTYRHAGDIAARARRFTDRSDAADQARYEAWVRGRMPDGTRRQRVPGARKPGRRS